MLQYSCPHRSDRTVCSAAGSAQAFGRTQECFISTKRGCTMPAFTFEKISPPDEPRAEFRRSPTRSSAALSSRCSTGSRKRASNESLKAEKGGIARNPQPTDRVGSSSRPCAAADCSSPRCEDAGPAPAHGRDRRRSRRAPDGVNNPDRMTNADGARCRAIGAASCRSGLARMFASTRSNGARARELRRGKAGGANRLHQMPGHVEPRIVAGDLHRGRIDVARQHRCRAAPWRPRSPARRCRCRDRARGADAQAFRT